MDGGFFDAVEKIFCFEPWLWEVSSACGRTRYFPRAGKYPKGAGGGQRVHVAWPPPVPPLLSYSAPLASQGRAQLGSRPSLGGPLSPSAQLIPPPAPQRRSILRVSARNCYDRNTLQRYVPRHQGHARCVPAPATRLVAGPRPNQMWGTIRTLSVERQGDVPLPVQGGSGGIPRPFEGGIGGPGGHRGEVGIPPAPLAGGASPRRKSISQVPHSPLFTFLAAARLCCLFLCADSRGRHTFLPLAILNYPPSMLGGLLPCDGPFFAGICLIALSIFMFLKPQIITRFPVAGEVVLFVYAACLPLGAWVQ